jgi:Flp pilus assembly protein TadG
LAEWRLRRRRPSRRAVGIARASTKTSLKSGAVYPEGPMGTLLRRFWHDERGSVGMEWAFVATILVLGAITGVVASRQALLSQQEPPALTRAR